MDFLHKHVKDCDEEYICKHARETWPPNTLPLLPSRVLMVENQGNKPEVKLIVARDSQRANYIALSHCWGKSKNILTTTTQTLGQHLAGIDWDCLPKTFRDALTVTAELNINYLWIDSLCILQDDPRDWEIESAKMGDIYSKSYLTIAATGSADCDGGLLKTRQRVFDEAGELAVPHKIKEIFHPITNTDTKIFVRHAMSSGDLQLRSKGSSVMKPMFAPLLTRAWCFQERLLSPRVIHFHGEEMIFECKTMTRCECTALDFDHNRAVRIYGQAPESFKYRFNQVVSHGGNTEEIASFWLQLVALYMDLRLTKESDRFPAIAGLAKLIGPYFDSYYDPQRSAFPAGTTQYVAGLWRHKLPESLLWRRSSALARCWRNDTAVPTWSWAAIRYDNNQNVRGISWENQQVDACCKVIDVLGPLPGVDEHLCFANGKIILRAAMASVVLIPVKTQDLQDFPDQTKSDIRIEYALSFNGGMDLDKDVAMDLTFDKRNAKTRFAYERVCCILIASIKDFSYPGHSSVLSHGGHSHGGHSHEAMVDIALVVREISEGVYERIGLSKHSKRKGRFEGARAQVLHLV